MSVENKIFIANMLIGAAIVAGLLWLFPQISPNAPNQLARALILISGIAICMIMILTWAIRMIDGSTDAWWAETIGGHPIASAIVLVAVIGAVVAGFLLIPR